MTYSGGLVIDITTSVQVLIAPVRENLRKAILYNYNDPLHPGFQREIMPITWGGIQVPFHPQIDDMIFIKGDNPHPWLAKVLTIQERAKTTNVFLLCEGCAKTWWNHVCAMPGKETGPRCCLMGLYFMSCKW